jgi:hypothetical protein
MTITGRLRPGAWLQWSLELSARRSTSTVGLKTGLTAGLSEYC